MKKKRKLQLQQQIKQKLLQKRPLYYFRFFHTCQVFWFIHMIKLSICEMSVQVSLLYQYTSTFVACVAGGIVGFRAYKQKRRSRDSERRSREWLGEEKLKYRLPGWAAFLASAPLFAF